MIVVEITAAVDASGTLETLYVSTDRFVTSPTDMPAGIAFDPRLIDPGTIGVHIFADGRTGGATKLETGEIVLANADGALDAWLNYSFDGRPVTIRSGNDGAAYPGSFSTLFSGTIEAAEATWDKFTLRLRDKQWRFTLPTLSSYYAGNNVLPDGLEGTATDIGGRPKPKTYGSVFNVSALPVNTSTLAYQVSNGAVNDISAVYDRGASITKGADFATSALLQAATPTVGTYITCFAEGYFRLGSTPTGTITADVSQGPTAAVRTVAQILKQMALDSGFSSGEISAADVTALDAIAPQVVGIWISDTSTFQQSMDLVAASVGAWYGFDSAGLLRMGQLLAPSGTPAVTLYDYDVLNGVERRPPRDEGIPVWRVVLGYAKNWTVQGSDVAGIVTAASRSYLAQEYRYAESNDPSIKTQWLLAGTMSATLDPGDVIDTADNSATTLLTSASDADAEAARRLILYKDRRDLFDVPVSLDFISVNTLALGSVIDIQLPRFGMGAGRIFRLIGISLALAAGTATLTLWG